MQMYAGPNHAHDPFEATSSSEVSNNLLLHGGRPDLSSLPNTSLEEFPGAAGELIFISILSRTVAFSS